MNRSLAMMYGMAMMYQGILNACGSSHIDLPLYSDGKIVLSKRQLKRRKSAKLAKISRKKNRKK